MHHYFHLSAQFYNFPAYSLAAHAAAADPTMSTMRNPLSTTLPMIPSSTIGGDFVAFLNNLQG